MFNAIRHAILPLMLPVYTALVCFPSSLEEPSTSWELLCRKANQEALCRSLPQVPSCWQEGNLVATPLQSTGVNMIVLGYGLLQAGPVCVSAWGGQSSSVGMK